MRTIRHRFENRIVSPDTEILVLGTFNPETPENPADFFYGRVRNHLWRLLPTCFNHTDSKNATKEQKQVFIATNKIDFVDLIAAVTVEEGKEADYSDAYIDWHVSKWTNVIGYIGRLPNLKKILVTRKTFSDVPRIKAEVEKISEHCNQHQIRFEYLPTPARFYNAEKQDAWNQAFAR